MTGRWLRSVAVIAAGVTASMIVTSRPAYSRRKKEATPTPTMTPTATPTPEKKVWNFDQDKKDQIAGGWQATDGDWEVFSDPSAPSQPNDFGLPSGRMVSSLMHGLDYQLMAVVKDPTEYGDFVLEADFKPVKGYFDCSGGLVFRYGGPQNFYVLAVGCPSDYMQLIRMFKGKSDIVQQKVVATDPGNWYKIKVDAEGDHFTCYDDNKMIFDAQDNKIAKGRIGVWASNDSQSRFDNITITLPLSSAPAASSPGTPAGAPPPPPPPPP